MKGTAAMPFFRTPENNVAIFPDVGRFSGRISRHWNFSQQQFHGMEALLIPKLFFFLPLPSPGTGERRKGKQRFP